MKFFLYTFLGSVFMLVALIYMYSKAGDYSIASFQSLPLTMNEQVLIFFAFLLAFAVKVPMFPVHTWLPDAHVEAPTGGSVILAAILLKMGGYGFIRFSLPITPDASHSLAWLMIGLSLIAVVYIGFVALVQADMKKLIAYSSIAHMGFVTLGFFVIFLATANAPGTDGARLALQGGMMQMLSHGLISGAMFLCVGVLYDRMHSRQIADYGGVVNTMPKFAALMVLFALANAGLPGTSGFVGEFFVIIGSFHASAWLAFFAATTLVLGAAYTLWMVKRVVFGAVANEHVAELPGRERPRVLDAHGARGGGADRRHLARADRERDGPDAWRAARSRHPVEALARKTDARHADHRPRRRRPGGLPHVRDLRACCSSTCSCATPNATSRTCCRC